MPSKVSRKSEKEIVIAHSEISIKPRLPGKSVGGGLAGITPYLILAIGVMTLVLPAVMLGFAALVTGQYSMALLFCVVGVAVFYPIVRYTKSNASREHEASFRWRDGMRWVSKDGKGEVSEEFFVPFTSSGKFTTQRLPGRTSYYQVVLEEKGGPYYVHTYPGRSTAEDLASSLNEMIPPKG